MRLLVIVAVSWQVVLPPSLNVCEQMSRCISMKNLGGLFLANLWFYKGQTPHFCFPLKVISHFLCGQLLTESVIQQKRQNKTIVTYNPFGQMTSPRAVIWKVIFDHVISRLHTCTAVLPESHHSSCFMNMSTIIQVIIYYWVSAQLLAGRQGIQKWSH